jgi:hypothetical protein
MDESANPTATFAVADSTRARRRASTRDMMLGSAIFPVDDNNFTALSYGDSARDRIESRAGVPGEKR